MSSDAEGRTVVVLRASGRLNAVPTDGRKFALGQEIRARAVTHQVPGDPRWLLVWELDDPKHERVRDRGRER